MRDYAVRFYSATETPPFGTIALALEVGTGLDCLVE
jgi:hypothetical protein